MRSKQRQDLGLRRLCHEVRECYRIIETELNQLSVAETATETVSKLSTLEDVEAQAEALRKGRFDKTRADER